VGGTTCGHMCRLNLLGWAGISAGLTKGASIVLADPSSVSLRLTAEVGEHRACARRAGAGDGR
jgi:hypothetical protein